MVSSTAVDVGSALVVGSSRVVVVEAPTSIIFPAIIVAAIVFSSVVVTTVVFPFTVVVESVTPSMVVASTLVFEASKFVLAPANTVSAGVVSVLVVLPVVATPFVVMA